MAILNKGTIGNYSNGGNPGYHGYYDYNNAKSTARMIADTTGLTALKNSAVSGDGSGGNGYGSAEVVNPYAEARSAWDSWLNDILGYYKGLYDNARASIDQNFQSTRNQANVKRKIGENWIKSNSPYDEGRFYKLGNQNQQTWINATMNARNERDRATNQALADYNNQKADARSIYAQKIAGLM